MLVGVVLYFLSVVYLDGSEASLFEPRRRCVPTATVRGTCHLCVCTTEGLFHCRPQPCQEIEHDNHTTDGCEPGYLYREDTLFCSCTSHGFWRSTNCKEKFLNLRPKNYLIDKQLRTSIACEPGTLYLVDCNICQCQTNGLIAVASCTYRLCYKGHKADKCKTGDILRLPEELCSCSDINYYIDRLCIKTAKSDIQIVKHYDLSKIIDIGRSWRRQLNSICDPEIVYTYDCNQCVCDSESRLVCSSRICAGDQMDKALRNVKSEGRGRTLPMVSSYNDRCKTGKVYKYNCNTCFCSGDGVLSCTTMICLKDYPLDVKSLRAALSTE